MFPDTLKVVVMGNVALHLTVRQLECSAKFILLETWDSFEDGIHSIPLKSVVKYAKTS